MDGWVVAPDAPVLRPDWHTTLPAEPQTFLSRLLGRSVPRLPGRYVVDPGGGVPPRATWQLIGQG